jgi:hypothetical protein
VDANAAVDYLGPYTLAAGSLDVLPYNPQGWARFPDGIRAFASSGTARVSGSIEYEIQDE